MTATQFYNNFGRYILRQQTDPTQRSLSTWPYFNPLQYPNDIPIDRPEIKRRFRCCGIVYPGYLIGVMYNNAYITYMKLPSQHCSVISFEFSGCYMAKVCFKKQWYAFHISTSETASCDCKHVWMDFLHHHLNDISAISMSHPNDRQDLVEIYKANRFGNTLTGLMDTRSMLHALVYDFEQCVVTGSNDANIGLCHAVLLSRNEDRGALLSKYI